MPKMLRNVKIITSMFGHTQVMLVYVQQLHIVEECRHTKFGEESQPMDKTSTQYLKQAIGTKIGF